MAGNRHICEGKKANFVPFLEKMYFFIMIQSIVWLWFTYLDFFVQKKQLHVGTQKCRNTKTCHNPLHGITMQSFVIKFNEIFTMLT